MPSKDWYPISDNYIVAPDIYAKRQTPGKCTRCGNLYEPACNGKNGEPLCFPGMYSEDMTLVMAKVCCSPPAYPPCKTSMATRGLAHALLHSSYTAATLLFGYSLLCKVSMMFIVFIPVVTVFFQVLAHLANIRGCQTLGLLWYCLCSAFVATGMLRLPRHLRAAHFRVNLCYLLALIPNKQSW